MMKITRTRAAVALVSLAFWSFSLSANNVRNSSADNSSQRSARHGNVKKQNDPTSTQAYYSLRGDKRRCASPMCGGYFVKRVNQPLTRCSDGKDKAECYVAEIQWNGQQEVEAARAILGGTIEARTYPSFGRLGVLRVTESWEAASNNAPNNSFYRVTDRGIACITQPCPTHHEAKLNSTSAADIAGVDLTGAGAEENVVRESWQYMSSADGIIVSGSHAKVTGPAGASYILRADQFYVRTGRKVETGTSPTKRSKSGSPMKQCIRTGCSNQICSDKEMVTTCEFRPEYACYARARCERQADGSCGFTRTSELAACLAKKRS